MNIVDAYRRTGSYRAAVTICGVNHKTVRPVVERSRRGGSSVLAHLGAVA